MREGDRRARRREQLLEAALAVFVDKGYHAATVDDVVARAQVARGTFYLYFPDKRAAFEALVDGLLQRLEERVQRIDLERSEPPLEQLRDNLLRVTELAFAEPALVGLVLREGSGVHPECDAKVRSFFERLRHLVRLSLTDGQERGLVRAGDREVMAAVGLGGARALLLEAVSGHIRATPGELTDELLRFLARGILSAAV